ncbi:hypothetical protein LGM43_05365 [Burkholderia seminalis]|uniref:hypothetical protein n=1 Tax=Burkholderia cepacia complex TaxID=87882 RepID=UPI001592C7D1|nr:MULTISPECIES: hypothetical protein [Burkholderia cepacia complex]MCA7949691.1 hypothetical protein [Burkholderia seminalis]
MDAPDKRAALSQMESKPSDGVRDAIFEHQIFWPSGFGLVAHAPDFRRTESAWKIRQADVDAELDQMQREGLVSNSMGLGWTASLQGQVAREQRWQALGRRHPALNDPGSAVADLVLALVKSGGAHSEIDARLHLPDHELDIYLAHVAASDRDAAIESLVDRNLLTRGFDLRDLLIDGTPLRTTPDGDRHYAHRIVPLLGLRPPATILAPIDEEPLPFDELGLEAGAADNLRFRWEEAQRCMGARAWFAAALLFGSMLELVLLDWLRRDAVKSKAAKGARDPKTGSVRPIEDWKLATLIAVAAELGYLDNAIEKFAGGLRDTRNFIHPDRHIRERSTPDEHVAMITQQTARAVFDALARATRK